jgi:cell division septation protein DedD
MTDQQTDNGQATGRQGLSRGVLLVICLVVAALFVTIWVKLASKNVEIDVTAKQPAIEQGTATGESKLTGQGDWYVSLATFRLEKDAEAMLNRLARQGVKADSVVFIGSRKGYIWHRIYVGGFASEQEALQALVTLSKKTGIRNARVGQAY